MLKCAIIIILFTGANLVWPGLARHEIIIIFKREQSRTYSGISTLIKSDWTQRPIRVNYFILRDITVVAGYYLDCSAQRTDLLARL